MIRENVLVCNVINSNRSNNNLWQHVLQPNKNNIIFQYLNFSMVEKNWRYSIEECIQANPGFVKISFEQEGRCSRSATSSSILRSIQS